MDAQVGRIINTLDTLGITNNTIVVFLSDNGGAISKNASSNGPLRGAKSDLYEGGIRVPFAIQWLGTIPGNLTYTEPVISLDIFSTIAAITEVEISPDRPLDGVNLIPYLTGKNLGSPHDQLFWRKWEQQGMAVRSSSTKLVANVKRNNQENILNHKNNILHSFLLKEVFNIDTNRQEDLNYLSYLRGNKSTIKMLDKEEDYDVVCFVNPPSLDDVFNIAEGGETMPQKSTYFYPKVYSGLVTRCFNK